MKTIVFDRIKAFAMALLLVLALFALARPIMENAGIAEHPTGIVVAEAAGLDDINISSDGKVSFSGESAGEETPQKMLDRGKEIVKIILSAASLVSLAFLIIFISKFAGSGDNDNARRSAIKGMLTCGIATALLGSVTIIYSFAYGAFSGL